MTTLPLRTIAPRAGLLLALAALPSACSTAAPRSPVAPTAPTVAATTAPTTAPRDRLLSAVPAGSVAAAYVHFGALMREPALQVLWPLAAYQPAAAPVRAACGDRLWEQIPEFTWVVGAHESDRDDDDTMIVAAGPIAAEAGRPCAAAWFRDPSRQPTTHRGPDGAPQILFGPPGIVARQASVAEGGATLGASDSFEGMIAPLDRVRAEVVFDVAASRERHAAQWRELRTLARELADEGRRVRALRLELADADEGRLRVRLVARYGNEAQARGSAERLGQWFGRGIPSWLTLSLATEVRESRERLAMLAAMSDAYGRWMRGLYQPQVVGRDVVVESVVDQGYLLIAGMALFIGFERTLAEASQRTHSAEARTHVQRLADAVVTRWNALPRPRRRLPAAIALTPPALPGTEAVIDPPTTWEAPAWRALGFRMEGAHRYAYELVSDGRATFTARATGDLDGDGVRAVFAITGRVAPDGSLALDPMTVENELE